MAKPGGLKNKGYGWLNYDGVSLDIKDMETSDLVHSLRYSGGDRYDEIKAELATREHLRTKAQAKADRQTKAKAKKHR